MTAVTNRIGSTTVVRFQGQNSITPIVLNGVHGMIVVEEVHNFQPVNSNWVTVQDFNYRSELLFGGSIIDDTMLIREYTQYLGKEANQNYRLYIKSEGLISLGYVNIMVRRVNRFPEWLNQEPEWLPLGDEQICNIVQFINNEICIYEHKVMTTKSGATRSSLIVEMLV